MKTLRSAFKNQFFSGSLFMLLASLFLTSCSSDKDKLVGNWKVTYVQVYNEMFEKNPEDTTMFTMMSILEDEWEGCSYLLNEDGSFKFTRKEGETTEGKWSFEDGIVKFTPANGNETFNWRFYNKDITVSASDGSISPAVPTGGNPEKNYIQ